MTHSHTHDDSYKATFEGNVKPDERLASALAVALDVRKFEIDLYWKRASYFWVFTGAALAAHLAALTSNPNRAEAMLLTSCVGFVFAFAWYLVNRASKFWQSNWEAHVDLLEDKVNGPLYKTVLSDEGMRWWKLHGAYRFSVSNINQLLSLYVVVVFALLILNTVLSNYKLSWHFQWFPTMCLLLTGIAAVFLVVLGRPKVEVRWVSRERRITGILNDG